MLSSRSSPCYLLSENLFSPPVVLYHCNLLQLRILQTLPNEAFRYQEFRTIAKDRARSLACNHILHSELAHTSYSMTVLVLNSKRYPIEEPLQTSNCISYGHLTKSFPLLLL